MNEHQLKAKFAKAIEFCKERGIQITNIELFDWTNSKNGLPSSCDPTGAILVQAGLAAPYFPQGWLKNLCTLLEVDSFWLIRFWQGLRTGKVGTLTYLKEGQEIIKNDDARMLGIQILRGYIIG